MYLEKPPLEEALMTEQTVRQFFHNQTVDTGSFESDLGPRQQTMLYEPGATTISSQNHFLSPFETVLPQGLGDDFWIPDKSTKTCYNCESKFNLVKRRHHCRICGHIYCQKCSFKREVEPMEGISAKKARKKKKEVIRVCDYCSDTLDDYIQRVKESAILIKGNIPDAPPKMGSLSELDNPSIIYSPKRKKRQFGEPGPIPEEDEDEPAKQEKRDLADIIPEELTSSNPTVLSMPQGTAEDDEEPPDPAIYSYGMEDFLSEGKAKGDTPLERMLSTQGNLNPNHAVSFNMTQRALFEYAELHLEEAVRSVSQQFQISDCWGQRLFQMVLKAVEQVKTSSRLLNDPMNFHRFVRIKRFQWPDHTRSEYINGIMATKNVADKRMASDISNPKILLISSPLQFYGRPEDRKNYSAINSLIHQESYYLDILMRKIKLLQPNIIVTPSGASRSVLDSLRKIGITVITNVKQSVLQFLARCTQTIILPSIDLIDKGVVLGTCSHFYIKKIQSNPRQMFQIDEQDQESNQKIKLGNQKEMEMSENIVIMDRSKMVFEGCNPVLGCTLVISGPNMKELGKVKQVLRKVLKIARNLILERSYLLQCGLEYPNYMMQDDDDSESRASNVQNLTYSPFLGKNFSLLENKQILVSHFRMALGIAGRQSVLNTQEMVEAAQHGSFSSSSSKKTQSGKIVPLNVMRQNTSHAIGAELSESKVKQYIDKICGKQQMERLEFYQGKDKQLGAIISQKIATAHLRCEGCKRPNYMHYTCYYMLDGRLKISMSINKQREALYSPKRMSIHKFGKPEKRHFLPGSGRSKGKLISKEGRITSTAMKIGQAAHEAAFRQPIITYCYCRLCRRKVTPREAMSNQYYEYSFSCFLLQYFLNDQVVTRARVETTSGYGQIQCGHVGHRAIVRVFRQGPVFLKLEFQSKQKFKFQPLYLLPSAATLFKQRAASNVSFKTRDAQLLEINFLSDFVAKLFQKYNKQLESRVVWEAQDLLKRVEDQKKFSRLNSICERNYIGADQVHILKCLLKIIAQLNRHCEEKLILLTQIKGMGDIGGYCLLLLLESVRYHLYKLASKYRLVVRQILRCATNIIDFAMQAKLRLAHSSKEINNSPVRTETSAPANFEPTAQSLPTNQDAETLFDLAQEQEDPEILEEVRDHVAMDMKFERTKTFQSRSIHSQVIFKSRKLENLWPRQESRAEKLELMDELNSESFDCLRTPYVRLKPGFNGCFLPIHERNWGSYVAYILNSDLYREALASENYFTLKQQLMNFPTFLPAGYRGNVLVQEQDQDRASIALMRNSRLQSRKSAMPRLQHSKNPFFTPTSYEQDELQILQNTLTPHQHPTWYFYQEQPNKKSQEKFRLQYKLLPSSLDVFNTEDINKQLVEDQLLRESKVHMTFRFSGDGKQFSVRINRDGLVVNREMKSSVRVVSNCGPDFTNLFHDLKLPKIYHAVEKLNSYIYCWTFDFITTAEANVTLPNVAEESSTTTEPSTLPVIFSDREHPLSDRRKDTIKRASTITILSSSNLEKRDTIHDLPEIDISLPEEMEGIDQETKEDMESQENKTQLAAHLESIMANQKLTIEEGYFKQTLETAPVELEQANSFPANISHLMSQVDERLVSASMQQQEINNNDYSPKTPTKRVSSLDSDIGSPIRRRGGQAGGISFLDIAQDQKESRVIELTVYFANKFEALRRHYIGALSEFVGSVARSSNWNENSGGKSGSAFMMTEDKRYIMKSIPKQEMLMFLSIGVGYFRHMGKHFFHGMPSLMAKTLGVYKLSIKESAHSRKSISKVYFLIQENIFYRTKKEKVIAYDLKGSEKRRYVKRAPMDDHSRFTLATHSGLLTSSIFTRGQDDEPQPQEKEKQSKVLLDTNFLQDFNGEPVAVSAATKIYIDSAINNDSLMLSMGNVMDYSLLVVIDTEMQILRAGIIDYMRQYTFDKMLEHSVKYVVNAGLQPTITNPEMYKKRFRDAINSYFVGMLAKSKECLKQQTKVTLKVLPPPNTPE